MSDERSVLIVDDEADVSEVLAFTLRREGFRVQTASEAAEALALARSERPDIVLLDVMMPGISGWEMLERMKADDATRDIPIVMCTVLAEPRFIEKAAEQNAAGYIRKPFKPEAVVRTIKNILQAGAPARGEGL
jgi:CheY-like chemotaxis protein